MACAKPDPIIVVYEPERCPHYIWSDEALVQLENIMYIDKLHDDERLETINDYDNGRSISTEFGLILQNIGEYNRHCNALDAYLDTHQE